MKSLNFNVRDKFEGKIIDWDFVVNNEHLIAEFILNNVRYELINIKYETNMV